MKTKCVSLALAVSLCIGSAAADSVVVFNEIMYHPLTNELAFEWVELQNQMSVDVDISGWSLDDGIDFRFAEGTVIRGGGYLVVALSPAAMMAATGLTNVVGPFLNRLSNAGERLRLRDNNRRIIDEITYGVEGDWPVAPDGAGPSLARRRSNIATADSRNWAASSRTGGTPGGENFPARPPTIVSNTVVSVQSPWRYDDSGTDLGTSWRDRNYDDSAWSSGLSLFYLGEAPLPAMKNTPLASGPSTYFFRTSFTVTGELSRMELQLRPVIDDGAVFYLNGAEISRLNMPPGPVSYSTLAHGLVRDANFGETIRLPADSLLLGANVVAVELHQAPTFTAYAQAILNSSPIGYWRLGETSGAAADSATAPAAPEAGSQDGAYLGFNAVNLGQAGPRPTDSLNGFETTNAAPRFAGNADAGNDVVTIRDPGVFNFASTRTFTIEAWVNASSVQEDGAAVIAKGVGGGGEQFAIDVVGGRYRFFCWDGGAPNVAVVAGAAVGPNGTWQHIAAVLDQPGGRMKIYVNGVESGSAVPRPTLVNTVHEISIGARKNSASANYDLNFDGRIDEVAIFNRALSTNDILAHFNAAFTTNTASGHDTNDAVFGMEVVTAETLREAPPALVAFNELASSTNSAFWLELINYGSVDVDLGGWFIRRFGGTNRQYVLSAQILRPGELLQVTKAQMGFSADSGDRLALYKPGGNEVADAVVAKKDPRGRSPDGTGAWWFPQQASPGASNIFVFRDELVINEIMYHQRELPPEAATYSPTNVVVTITNAWRYNIDGVEQPATWREHEFDDSEWLSGSALFYAPTNPFVLPAPRNTPLPLTNSSGARIITFYFRTQFTFDGDTNNVRLALHPIIDDGAVFYVNGVEVYRLNMPTTNISYGTLATLNVGTPVYTGPVLVPADSLTPGLNTLAVEVHQVTPFSADAYFGTALLAFNELTPALPFRHSPESWVEIFNRSSNAVDLTGWRLDEGIDFRFPAGKILGSGGYTVVAKDVPQMRSLYPGLDVVGPFTNRLSRRSDYFVLKDPNNNLTDEVRYYDEGNWPRYADGGGGSLELRDPFADNLAAEAWAASDETGKSAWQTFTWRGLSAPSQAGEPTLWREFALCLLDGAGEVLLDDISVIETPTNSPRQLLYNGTFDGGSAAHWRLLGNHRHSRVEPEPGNPGNYVLHLVATGPGEYQGNQIETTFINNTNIVEGRQYEISFRARWLAGKRKLNARLYFNRLARTFDLSVPVHSGTPGQRNSRYATNIGPTCSDLAHSPVVPNPGWPLVVTVRADDPDGVASITLKYSIGGGPWQSVAMTNDAHHFAAKIPGQPAASVVQFYIEAQDALGAVASYPVGGANSRALFVVNDNQGLPGPLHQFRLIMTPADAASLHTGTNTLSNELLGATVIYDEQEVFYNVGVRLKGSFVGRNVARVGFHVVFNPDQLFRGVHEVVSVDRSQHVTIGGVGEIIVKHIGNHAGGMLNVYHDVGRFIGHLPAYTTTSELRLSAYDNDYLDAQFEDGSDGPMFEVEVLRWNLATVDGNPESPKQVGNESGGTGYANLEMQNYGDNKDNYRWFLLPVNNRTADDFTQGIAVCKAFSLTGVAFDQQARQLLDLDEWLRVMAYQELVGTADAYFTGANIHNFRLYVRPEDRRILYLPWDWDSAFLASATAPIIGTGNIAKLLTNLNHRRAYLNHMFDLLTTTFNSAYISRWIAHYGGLVGQDLSGISSYISSRASFALSQLPTATAFAITTSAGNNFGVSNSVVTLSGSAPIAVKTIEVNGVTYAINWSSTTTWTLTVPLAAGTNLLVVQGVDNYATRRTNMLDTITVTNYGPSALHPVVINEWMADNAGPGGLADPADGLFQDWFELFNPNTNAVNLGGFYLTDNRDQPTNSFVPANTIIGPRSFLLVWADNEPHQNRPGGDLHAGFRLSAGGEAIILFTPDGVTPHSIVNFGQQTQNVSEGLFPDGNTNAFYSMTNWTPRTSNVLGLPPSPNISNVTIEAGDTLSFSFPTLRGRTYQVQYKDDLSAPNWSLLGPNYVGNGTQIIIADDITPSPQRFYRIILLQ